MKPNSSQEKLRRRASTEITRIKKMKAYSGQDGLRRRKNSEIIEKNEAVFWSGRAEEKCRLRDKKKKIMKPY